LAASLWRAGVDEQLVRAEPTDRGAEHEVVTHQLQCTFAFGDAPSSFTSPYRDGSDDIRIRGRQRVRIRVLIQKRCAVISIESIVAAPSHSIRREQSMCGRKR
jgi:hypothetical protein